MTVTTVASSVTLPANRPSQRHVARTSSGRLWVAHRDGSNLRFSYSDDTGGTWSLATPNISGAAKQWSIFCDVDDNLWCVVVNSSDYLDVWVNDSITTSSSWAQMYDGTTGTFVAADIVAFTDPTNSSYLDVAVLANRGATDGTGLTVWKVAKATPATIFSVLTSLTVGGGTAAGPVALDFVHTGNGKTAASSPHLWSAFMVSTDDLVCKRHTYSAGSWDIGVNRVLDSTADTAGPLTAVFDGTRFLVVAQDATDTSLTSLFERSAGDTSTTSRTVTALSDGDIDSLSITSDGDDVWIAAAGQTSDDPKVIVYDRSANSWGSWSAVEATTVTHPYLSFERCNNAVSDRALVWSDTDCNFELVGSNRAPTTPTWVTTAQGFDEASDHTLAWQHNDPDGDSQHSLKLRRSVNSAAYTYWNGSTWTTEGWVTSATQSITVTAATVADGDSIAYQVATRDADLAESGYSATLTLTYAAADNPTIDTPADEGTWTTAEFTVDWTVAEQSAYRAVLKTGDGASTLEDSGWQTSTDTSHTFTYQVSNGVSYDVEVTTRNNSNITSATDKHDFTVSYTGPMTPTLAVTGGTPTGAITVAITNPAPTGGEPAVTSNDVYVRVASGGTQEGERTVADDGIRIATGVAEDGSYVDWAVASGTVYEYRVLAKASSNGTSTWSAWTA